jgi:hypothetical protein
MMFFLSNHSQQDTHPLGSFAQANEIGAGNKAFLNTTFYRAQSTNTHQGHRLEDEGTARVLLHQQMQY